MKRKSSLKITAVFLTFFYLVLSGVLAFGTGGHMLKHGGSAHHAKQHASFLCTWMCAAGTSVHSTEQPLPDVLFPAVEGPVPTLTSYLSQDSIEIFHIRPPPDSIA